jgi:tetratricopeptide (TPR) repeat protein
MLKCRTAEIGIIIILALVFQRRFHLLQWIILKLTWTKKILVVSTAITLIYLLAILSFCFKKESTQGRKLIWYISAGMIKDKPLMGYGYGMFERNYNLAQAAYFEAGKGSKGETRNASQTFMAYNEYLENAIEGGFVGCLFFISFIALLTYGGITLFWSKEKGIRIPLNNKTSDKFQKRNHQATSTLTPGFYAFAGILAFAFMSIINFTVTAIPVMCVLLNYAALLIAESSTTSSFKVITIKPFFKNLVATTFIILGVYLVYSNIQTANAHHRIKKSIVEAKYGDLLEALNQLDQQPAEVKHTESYCRTLGALYFKSKRYENALNAYQQASVTTSSPELYMQMGNCQKELHQFDRAIDAYQKALYIQPALFEPRYALLQLYLSQKDTSKVLQTAEGIIRLESKVEGGKIRRYKEFAQRILSQFKD